MFTHSSFSNIDFYHTPKPAEIVYTYIKSVLTFIQSIIHSHIGSADVMS